MSADGSPPSDALSEDFYCTTQAAVDAQLNIPSPTMPPHEATPFAAAAQAGNAHEDMDTDDSSSEMELSTPSPPASPMPLPIAIASPAKAVSADHAGTKRKLSDDSANSSKGTSEEPAKKRKADAAPVAKQNTLSASPHLSPKLWQHIFLHLSPVMLSRCLRVCKSFKSYLTDMEASTSQGRIHDLESETIWTESRKTFLPQLPKPLADLSELEMLQLIGGGACQLCRKWPPVATLPPSIFKAGPGEHGVRVIWPFHIRCCGACLEYRILKDTDVLSHSVYKDLRFGVPHGFRSPELHFVSDSVRQTQGIPASYRCSKIYYKPGLEKIHKDAITASTFGAGAAEEWRKGLDARGKEAMADSARWERWELSLPPGISFAQILRTYDPSSFARHPAGTQSRPTGVGLPQPPLMVNGTHPLPRPVHVFGSGQMTQHHHFSKPQLNPSQLQLPQPQHLQSQLSNLPLPRPVRDAHQAEEARQARRSELERRCLELVPPVEPKVLIHMEAFQAAMQITAPMTDATWEMLKPKILAQHGAASLQASLQQEEAALLEHNRATKLAVLSAASGLNGIVMKSTKEPVDREFELAQEPLREVLGGYASDYIDGPWGGPSRLNKDNAPIFAVDVLLHVQQRYRTEKQNGLLPRFEPPKRKEASRQDTPPLEPSLTLVNMKWVWDQKVKPLTDTHYRELFKCAGCDEDSKWFAFDGLIQHFGAKHTEEFSKKNIVVHWQSAEWPEDAPFDTDPQRWLKKPDRRTFDQKSNGRSRYQGNHNGHSSASAPVTHNSGPQNYYGANYQTSAIAARPSPMARDGHHYHAEPVMYDLRMDYNANLNQFCNVVREVWDALDGIQDLEVCVRVLTSIQRATSPLLEQIRHEPTLDFLTEALTTNTLRPLKNAHGVACKSCVASSSDAASSTYWMRIKEAKLYNPFTLINHYKLMHQAQKPVDWSLSTLIELPDNKALMNLLKSPGMDDTKLALVAAAFPDAFPKPLPQIGLVTLPPDDQFSDGLPDPLGRLGKKSKNVQKKKKKNPKAANGTASHDDTQTPLPEPREDEYDPRRPMYMKVNEEEMHDRSPFDTDARKLSAPSTTVAQPAPGAFNLGAKDLAVLQNLAGLYGDAPAPVTNSRSSRSPSVGDKGHRAPSNPPGATPDVQVDLAAILATLTGNIANAQATTAPTATHQMPGSGMHQETPAPPGNYDPQTAYQSNAPAPIATYPMTVGGMRQATQVLPGNYEPQAAYQSDVRRTSSRHEVYQAPEELAATRAPQDVHAVQSRIQRRSDQNQPHAYAEAIYPAPVQPLPSRAQREVQAVQAYNQRQFDQNQPHAYVETTYLAPAQPLSPRAQQEVQAVPTYNQRQFHQHHQRAYAETIYTAPPQPLVPRYQYVYPNEMRYSQPAGHSPVYRDEAVQYMAPPLEREHAHRGHRYEHEAPAPRYMIDENGREIRLIPVEQHPVPVQYAAGPYEQQQHFGRRQEPLLYPAVPAAGHIQPVRDEQRPVYYEPPAPRKQTYDDNGAPLPPWSSKR